MLSQSEPPFGRKYPDAPDRSSIHVRDALLNFIKPLSPSVFKTIRQVVMPPLNADELPAISVIIMAEDGNSLGLPNMGPIEYRTDAAIGIQVTRGFDDPIYLQGGLEQDVAFLKNLFLTDAQFTRRWYGALFESIPSFRVRWVYPTDGEAYFGEMRLELVFRFPEVFVPTITDTLDEIDVRLRINQFDQTGIDITAKYFLWQEQRGYGNGCSNSSNK